MKSRNKNITQLIKERIHKVEPEAKVILYGSRARGDNRTDSDWDLLVLTNLPVDLQKERLLRNELYDIELDTEETISLIIYSKAEWEKHQRITPFYQNVSNEGILL